MTTQFSAGPQALGYLYQARYSLFALLSEDRMEAAMVIEGLDDISIEGEGLIELDQLKHHVTKTSTITSHSPDLWKSIRVWSESLKNGEWESNKVILNLITTAQADTGSIGALLRQGSDRNQPEALRILMEVANTSKNSTLGPSFAAFNILTVEQKGRLIDAITIVDGAKNILDISSEIKKKLRFSTTKEHVNSLYQRLEGWWFDKVVNHLMGDSQQLITQVELSEKINLIALQFSRDSLPIDYYNAEPLEEHFAEISSQMFVQQLNQLKLNTSRVRNAVFDYYRAFTQRSRWAREELLIDDEIVFYELRLKQEWGRYAAFLEDEFDDLDSDDNCVNFGKKFLYWAESVDLPIRSKMPIGHEYVARGSFHMLADNNPPEIYWHPKFIDCLNKVLTYNGNDASLE